MHSLKYLISWMSCVVQDQLKLGLCFKPLWYRRTLTQDAELFISLMSFVQASPKKSPLESGWTEPQRRRKSSDIFGELGVKLLLFHA